MLHTIQEVADILGLTPARVYTLVRAGTLPPGVAVRLGRQVRINRVRFEAWLQEGGRGLGAGVGPR